MGLDIYVGTLTRYHTGQWKTIVQQASESQGITTMVVRPGGDNGPTAPAEEVEEAVGRWRAFLSRSLAEAGTFPCDWVEGMSPPYFTDKPDWEGYAALVTWAAYAERPELTPPGKTLADWESDAVVRQAQAPEAPGVYDHLVSGAELWLPMEFEFTFIAPDLLGNKIQFGSVDTLHRQLGALNNATWKADSATISRWRREGLPSDKSLEQSARAGFAILHELSAEAKRHRLPIRLDY